MSTIPPWGNGPFELLVHAEGHLRDGDDFDRNAIEVAITTYLTLHPIQRGGRTYPKGDVEKWLNNYHTKLDFLETEITARDISWLVDRSHIVWTMAVETSSITEATAHLRRLFSRSSEILRSGFSRSYLT